MTYKDLAKRKRYLREYDRTHREQRVRTHHRAEWKAYGLDLDECERVYDSRTKCDICETGFNGGTQKNLDHDHKTKRIRGVLCANCNLAIGLLNDDPPVLSRAIEYLDDG